MGEKLRVLVVEDSEDDFLLLERELKRGGYQTECERVDTADTMNAALDSKKWDLIISDYVMPRFSGLEALKLLKEKDMDIPFILVSGRIGEDIAVDAMKAGAQDYIRKDNLKRLIPAVRRELAEADNRLKKKLAEEALRNSEARLKETQRIAHLGSWQLDLGSNTLSWSEEIFRIFEIDTEKFEATYESFLNAVHPDDRAMVDKAFTDSLLNKMPYELDHRLLMKDGRVKFVHERCETHYDANGKPMHSIGAVMDITERKQVEETLKKHQELLTMAEIIGNTGSWEYDVGTDTAEWSDNMFRIFDVDPEYPRALVFKYFVEHVVHPDDREHVLDIFNRTLKQETEYDLNYRIVRRDNSTRIIHAKAETSRDEKGNAKRMVGWAQDITERKQAEDALQKSETRYRSLFENMINGFAYCRMIFEDGKPSDFIYLDTNIAFETLTGLKNVVGKKVTEIIPGIRESNPELFEIYGRVAMTSRPERFETYLKSFGWLSISVYSIEKGCFVAIFDNVTERKHSENILQKNEQRVQTLLELFQRPHETEEEIIDFAIEKAIKLTDSELGFIGFIDELETTLYAYVWSKKAMQECAVDNRPVQISIKEGGLWAEAVKRHRIVVVNDYSKPGVNKKGCPSGHISLQRFLGIPTMRDGRTVFFCGLANKKEDYDETDIQQVNLFMEGLWGILSKRKVEMALLESESRFRQLTESLPQLFWTCLPDGQCDYLSRQWIEYTGIPESEQLGFGWLSQLHPDDRDRTIKAWNEAVKNKADFDIEFRIRRADGAYRWFKTRAVQIRDSQGKIFKWFGSNTDIDDLKQAESQLKKHREHLEDLVKERTADLEKKTAEVERINRLFVGRELKMVELKKKIAELEQKTAKEEL